MPCPFAWAINFELLRNNSIQRMNAGAWAYALASKQGSVSKIQLQWQYICCLNHYLKDQHLLSDYMFSRGLHVFWLLSPHPFFQFPHSAQVITRILVNHQPTHIHTLFAILYSSSMWHWAASSLCLRPALSAAIFLHTTEMLLLPREFQSRTCSLGFTRNTWHYLHDSVRDDYCGVIKSGSFAINPKESPANPCRGRKGERATGCGSARCKSHRFSQSSWHRSSLTPHQAINSSLWATMGPQLWPIILSATFTCPS